MGEAHVSSRQLARASRCDTFRASGETIALSSRNARMREQEGSEICVVCESYTRVGAPRIAREMGDVDERLPR
jgi:hypothetical protein